MTPIEIVVHGSGHVQKMFQLVDRASWGCKPLALVGLTFNPTTSCGNNQINYDSDDEMTWPNPEIALFHGDDALIPTRCRDSIRQDLVLAARWALLHDAGFTSRFNEFRKAKSLQIQYRETVSELLVPFSSRVDAVSNSKNRSAARRSHSTSAPSMISGLWRNFSGMTCQTIARRKLMCRSSLPFVRFPHLALTSRIVVVDKLRT